MQKKTYCRPEIQTITMLNEGMIAVSGKPDNRLGFGESEPVTPENPKPIGSRQKDEDNNSIWE
ncbi:MAG: hypothetical protein D8H91_04305 [Alloprevotella sp.]|nr:MAG: hypothetical protein D8H91_04305 [Alloprevotella sp.]